MRLFLDTSVLLAASGSANGASREIFRLASPNQWTLIATPYVAEEVRRNLSNFPSAASADWNQLRGELALMDACLQQIVPQCLPGEGSSDFVQRAGMGGCLVDTGSRRF